ncbi:hypothetical protein LCM23_06310 [Cytobacillus kochii]|uniref:hypothetical protein n=1 Tax=Cytobacillus kochii TaxID=859143 RepID=UPI001CD33E3A|nr:hypothetical protein [Cytobacillus kochii]MCA1025698.1 hypothetical protein [Cytobacillus kochii]
MRKPKNYLNYHLSTFYLNENFTMGLVKEVENLSPKQRKYIKRNIQLFISTTASFLTLSSKSMASAQITHSEQVITGIPTELLQTTQELIGLAVGSSVLLTILLLIGAGTLRQFRKKKEASEWTVDIIKGFIQIMIATPLVFILYYLTTIILGNFAQFSQPFQG